MNKQKQYRMLRSLKSSMPNLRYERGENGLIFYVSNLEDLLTLTNDLGEMGAYFNISYVYGQPDYEYAKKYQIVVIDFDTKWKQHNHDYV